LHLAGKAGSSRRSDFQQVFAATKQMLQAALMAGAEKFVVRLPAIVVNQPS
jgi:hypothetical protein